MLPDNVGTRTGHGRPILAAGQSRDQSVNFCLQLNFSRFAGKTGAYCGFGGPSFSGAISKRRKGKACQRFPKTRNGYGFSPGSNRVVKSAHQRTHRAFQDTQERSSFSSRPVEDGLAASESARLLEANRYPAISRSSRSTWFAQVTEPIKVGQRHIDLSE